MQIFRCVKTQRKELLPILVALKMKARQVSKMTTTKKHNDNDKKYNED